MSKTEDKFLDWDAIDVVCLCHAALAQDSPNPPEFYINQILNLMFGYLTVEQRQEVAEYLAEKKYLPDVKIEISK
jgi:hypothetical protein